MFVEPVKKNVVVETPIKYDDINLPQVGEDSSREVWQAFFKEHRPYPVRVRQGVMKLHREKKHKAVIDCLQAAMIHGQSQPWMYEVLALSMEIKGYPKADIERVVVSLSDFGAVTFENLMYSAAYLARFDRKSAALSLYLQASRISPERHEAYVLALPLAEEVGTTDDVRWAAEGILQNYWGDKYEVKHRAAEDAIFNQLRLLRRDNKSEEMKALAASLKQARARDVEITVEWSGQGDVDLLVEEPPGSVCSFETPLTIGGGIFLHDGTGASQDDCFEKYVCPQGVSGRYRIVVKKTFGKIVGDRAVVTVLMHGGTAKEEKLTRTLVLSGDEASFTVDLIDGRRTQPRNLSMLHTHDILQPVSAIAQAAAVQAHPQSQQQAIVLAQFTEGRDMNTPRRAGAVGYAPVIQTVPEGTSMSAQAIVSPDRRYVRLSLRPSFTYVTDVFTFSYQNRSGN